MSESPRYLVGESEAIRQICRLVQRCAPLDSTVLVTGESGTGKELVAEALHRLSTRRRGPFVALNCASIEPALADSELCGHERGAFTGAVARKVGKLEIARGGTLFLDEVAELPLESQAKLLRILEGRTFQRLGGLQTLKTDARLVAATHQNLREAVEGGTFREDLYYRLQVVEILVPPLRERVDDLEPLIEHFLGELRARIPTPARSFSTGALERLRRYEYPGNVRELRNIVERCLIFADGVEIQEQHLPPRLRSPGQRAQRLPESDEPILPLDEVERIQIERALKKVSGNKRQAANLLGINRSTLYAKIQRYGIEA